MEPIRNTYPIFEANQVLTNEHLNQVFNYLDEHVRLTRANLIGIGIVCGLDIRHDSATQHIHLTKGCGVTSEGYLIVEPDNLELGSYRDYKPPDDLGYTPLAGKTLWELLVHDSNEAKATNAKKLSAFPNLKDMVVLLFLELKNDELRNCSPNNCNDKGSEVTATVRRLLVSKGDMDKILAASTGGGLTPKELADSLNNIVGLKDIRLPRYDVPNTNPTTSEDVLSGFFEALNKAQLAKTTHTALNKAYDAFKSVLVDLYPSSPFAPFTTAFGFVDSSPQTTAQTRFLQYYYDFFDDLLKAYDEFCHVAGELLCLCCPPAGLFPRHLMLGEVNPTTDAVRYRHRFLPSPAVGDCADKTRDLRLLFQRLVEMTQRFTNNPPLSANVKEQIRITPSRLADVPLSTKSIPYYYTQDGNPPLYQLWNPDKTRRNRANQNLSYRADSYLPAAPAFVTDPLRYDLEPYNFLHIEGHLGKNYQDVLRTLAELKSRYRLPIDVIALRTGAFDETMPVDLSKEECRFQDIETLYKTLREELRCFLCKELQYFYDLPFPFRGDQTIPPYVPKEPLLKECAPAFRVKANTVGDFFETAFEDALDVTKYADPDQINLVTLIRNAQGNLNNAILIYLLYYLSKLGVSLPAEFTSFDLANFENRYDDLGKIAAVIEEYREEAIPQLKETANILAWEEIDDRIEAVMYACRLDAFKALIAEYKRRLLAAKQRQFLSHFLPKNPGLQHKAGVPLGGTFVLIYHDDPDPVTPTQDATPVLVAFTPNVSVSATRATSENVARVISKLTKRTDLALDPDVAELLAVTTGRIPFAPKIDLDKVVAKIFRDTVGQLADGTVIADFFLPYLCCSDCAPVQFVLPPPPLNFTVTLECTGANGAPVTITPQGGTAPYAYKIGTGAYQPLTGKPVLAAGPHTLVLRDSAGVESAAQTITIPPMLDIVVGENPYTENVTAQTYQVNFTIKGGTPPYSADSGKVTGTVYESDPVPSGKEITVKITDKAGCTKTSEVFKHEVPPPCNLPCKGIARRCGFRFWLPETNPDRRYNALEMRVQQFAFEFPAGGGIDLTNEVQSLLKVTPAILTNLTTSFEKVVSAWLARINKLIIEKTGGDDNLKLEYQKPSTGAFGTLWIEYFECLDFKFSIESSFRRPEIGEFVAASYTPRGTALVLADDTRPVEIPPSDCVRIDKCDPQRPTKAICKEPAPFLGKIVKQNTDAGVILRTSPQNNDPTLLYVWEVQDGIPAFANGEKAEFKFVQFDPPTKAIWLTVYNEKRCPVVSAKDTVNIPNQ